ncbi:MAG: DUF5693 family protein [Candidatus Bipolaricaulota bacterium]|nr:DUF5693 family protein [Candidatus Bipolaricaulota bacterium]
MDRALRIAGYTLFAVALVIALVIVISRVSWEEKNRRFISIAEDVDGLSLSQLADTHITAVAVHASDLSNGSSVSLQAIRAAGLAAVLIVDVNSLPQAVDDGAFVAWWAQTSIMEDDPLVMRLMDNDVPLVSREFSALDLTQVLWGEGYRNVIRGHEISEGELRKSSLSALASRWERAVRERGIRALILTRIPGDTPAQAIAYYKDVLSRLEASSYRNGSLPPSPPTYSQAAVILLHLGLCSLLLLILLRLIPSLPVAALLLSGAGALLLLGLETTILCQVNALLVTILAPTYAVLLFLPSTETGWRAGLRLVLTFIGTSLTAGILLSAFLSQPIFLLKVASFRGVKVSLILPPLIGVAVAYRSRWRGWRESLRVVRKNRHLPIGRILFRGLMLAASVGLILFIVMRSGNAEGLVSGTETRLRSLLETLFIARPRFKEFLIGHPLLFLFGASKGDITFHHYRPLLLLFGLIGQASILNTFAHAHTPFLLSLLRTGNGLVLGLALGMVLYVALHLVMNGWSTLRAR